MRKDLAEHVWETVCFGRNVNRVMDRVAICAAHHNLRKSYREAKGDLRSHAEVAGLSAAAVRRLQYGMFTRRTFATRIDIQPIYRKIRRREHVTPLKGKADNLPFHAEA